MTDVRIPPLPGGHARIRLVYQTNQALQVLGFDGPEWATAYENLDLTEEAVVELTPTADIATNDGSATCYLIIATATGGRGWSHCIEVPDSVTEVEMVDLVGATLGTPGQLIALQGLTKIAVVDALPDPQVTGTLYFVKP
jgi:hypothetical protein